MSKVRLTGSTSGYTEIQASAVAGDNTLNLPTTAGGTLLAADSSGNVNLDSGTFYVDAANNRVGVGTTSPSSTFHASASSGEAVIRVSNTGANSAWLVFTPGSSGTALVHNEGNAPTLFTTNGTERARITAGGYFKASDSGAYTNSAGTFHELYSTSDGPALWARNTNASLTSTVLYAVAARAANSAYHFLVATSGYGGVADDEFRLRGDGQAYADGSWNGGGADYAEYFEWQDENPDHEDRRGISVVLENDKIRPALDGEDPIGVISGNPSVVGDAAWNHWTGKYLRDEYGAYLLDANGDRQLNPDYDPDQPYVPREDRPEWSCVGLMGKLRIRKGQPTGTRWIKMRDISATVEEWLVR